MQIDSPEDIDMLRIVDKIPEGTHRLRAFMMRAKKKVTNERKYVAAVRLTADGPLMKFSRPNIEEVVENYTDLAFAVFHELLHILEGHLDLDRIRDRYRVPDLLAGQDNLREVEKNHEDISLEDKRRWKIVHFTNELEIKHMEHVLLPDQFQEMNRRLYGEDVDRDGAGEIPADKRILYRGNESFENPLYKRLHRRVYSKNRYSPLEAFRVLDRVLPDVPDEEEQQKQKKIKIQGGGQPQGDPEDSDGQQGGGSGGGASGEGDPSENDPSGGGGSDDEEEDEEEGGGGAGEEEGEEENGGGAGGQDEEEGEEEGGEEGQGQGDEEDDEGDGGINVSENDPLDHQESGVDEDANEEDLRDLADTIEEMAGNEGSPSENDSAPENAKQGGRGHTLKEQVAEAKRQAPVRQPKNREVEKEVKEAGTAPDFHSKVAADIQDEVGKAIRYSVRPNFQNDHRARIGRKLGHFVPKYKQARAPNREKIALYYDISGSQTEFIPACNQIVLHNKRHLANQSLFLFTTELKEMQISTFSKVAESGDVQNAISSYGTDFNVVVRHARENGHKKIVVLTDDVSEIDPSLIDPMIRSGQLEHILVVCTIEEKGDRTKEMSPGFIHGGPTGGYADKVVRVNPITQ